MFIRIRRWWHKLTRGKRGAPAPAAMGAGTATDWRYPSRRIGPAASEFDAYSGSTSTGVDSFVSSAAATPPALPRIKPVPQRQFVPGEELGEGGQGRVHVLGSDPSRAMKRFLQPVPVGEVEFRYLVRLGVAVRRHLTEVPVDFVWPERPSLDGDTLVGYIMPVISDDYREPIAGKSRERRLYFAVPREGPFRPAVTPDFRARVALVRAIAHFLYVLHRLDHVYGDISWLNFLFRLDPQPTVLVLDVDAIRRIGSGSLLQQPDAESRDWEDPTRMDLGFDRDRYKFSLLAYRLLIARDLNSRPRLTDAYATPDDFDASVVDQRHLGALFARSAGSAGGRPSIAEWLDALQPGGAAA